MSTGAAKVLSSLQSSRGREDELLHLLNLAQALRARREAVGAAPLTAEDGAVLGLLRRRLSRQAGDARRRLERALLKVELLRRRLVEGASESAEKPKAAGPDRERMIRRLQAAYLAKARSTDQAARQAALAMSRLETRNPEAARGAQDPERERVRGLAREASAMALAGYLADVKSSQPAVVLGALRKEIAAHVTAILRIESALRTVDGLLPSATADSPPAAPAAQAQAVAAPRAPAAEPRKKPSARTRSRNRAGREPEAPAETRPQPPSSRKRGGPARAK